MLAAGRDGDHIIGGVGRLDTEHAVILGVTEIGHPPGFFDPGIPDHGRLAAFFGNADAALPAGVDDETIGRGIEVDAVRFGREGDGALLGFATVVIELVDVGSIFQAKQAHLADVTDAKVGVQGPGAVKGAVAGIADDQINLQLRPHGNEEFKPERMRPESSGFSRVLQLQLQLCCAVG